MLSVIPPMLFIVSTKFFNVEVKIGIVVTAFREFLPPNREIALIDCVRLSALNVSCGTEFRLVTNELILLPIVAIEPELLIAPNFEIAFDVEDNVLIALPTLEKV